MIDFFVVRREQVPLKSVRKKVKATKKRFSAKISWQAQTQMEWDGEILQIPMWFMQLLLKKLWQPVTVKWALATLNVSYMSEVVLVAKREGDRYHDSVD